MAQRQNEMVYIILIDMMITKSNEIRVTLKCNEQSNRLELRHHWMRQVNKEAVKSMAANHVEGMDLNTTARNKHY